MRRHPLMLGTATLALVPLLSACTLTLGNGAESDSTATPAASAESPAPAETASNTPEETTEAPGLPAPPAETPEPAPTSAEATPEDASAAATPESQDGSAAQEGSGKGQKVNVPPGVGIKSMELIDLYGADSSSGSYGKAVGVFKVTTDRPMLIKLRVQLFNADGEEIARNDGLNSAYTVGTYNLVTSNLIKLPHGELPKSFKVTLVDVTDMKSPTFTELSEPKLGTRNGVPSLKGTFAAEGKMRSSHDVTGACIMPDGKVYSGTDGILDNGMTTSGGTSRGEYNVPLYDAEGVDLTKANCYAST